MNDRDAKILSDNKITSQPENSDQTQLIHHRQLIGGGFIKKEEEEELEVLNCLLRNLDPIMAIPRA